MLCQHSYAFPGIKPAWHQCMPTLGWAGVLWRIRAEWECPSAPAGLQQVVFNFEKTKDSLSGPVAIVAVGAEVARSDVAGLFQFAAILNINLAIINILP